MIAPICAKCQQELEEFGAILYSPPLPLDIRRQNSAALVDKYHLCAKCFEDLIDHWLE